MNRAYTSESTAAKRRLLRCTIAARPPLCCEAQLMPSPNCCNAQASKVEARAGSTLRSTHMAACALWPGTSKRPTRGAGQRELTAAGQRQGLPLHQPALRCGKTRHQEAWVEGVAVKLASKPHQAAKKCAPRVWLRGVNDQRNATGRPLTVASRLSW